MRRDLVTTSNRVDESRTPAMRATRAEEPSPATPTHSGAPDPDVTVSKRRSIFPNLRLVHTVRFFCVRLRFRNWIVWMLMTLFTRCDFMCVRYSGVCNVTHE